MDRSRVPQASRSDGVATLEGPATLFNTRRSGGTSRERSTGEGLPGRKGCPDGPRLAKLEARESEGPGYGGWELRCLIRMIAEVKGCATAHEEDCWWRHTVMTVSVLMAPQQASD